ncbi:hypothetical protein HFO98_10400 [Rhizobium leguminosarum]|uniref:hypothetical protein n=1 Tax=Rhizobium leguminosarum TaxID=384 RepID=UPI001C9380B7|nr:hypothetical protein [Rhizobium leguminosarum]MBY5408879.1 hypothetical protein [Rhizobium leguminosarum]
MSTAALFSPGTLQKSASHGLFEGQKLRLAENQALRQKRDLGPPDRDQACGCDYLRPETERLAFLPGIRTADSNDGGHCRFSSSQLSGSPA